MQNITVEKRLQRIKRAVAKVRKEHDDEEEQQQGIGKDSLDAHRKRGVGAPILPICLLVRSSIGLGRRHLRSKAPAGNKRQRGKHHHERKDGKRRARSRYKTAQNRSHDDAHVGKRSEHRVDRLELGRVARKIGRIRCGRNLRVSDHETQKRRTCKDGHSRMPEKREHAAYDKHAKNVREVMPTRTPRIERRATRKGTQNHKDVH